MKKLLTIFMLSLLLVVSCTTAPDGTKKVSKTGVGAGIGAAAGAVIGQAIGKDTKGTVIGNIFDRQEKELKTKLKGSGVEVERTGQGEIKLVAPENITFDTNSSIIKPKFEDLLDKVSEVLQKYTDSDIIVSGHTDSTGNDSINEPLSRNRASSVSSYLISKGVKSSRITSVGYGSRQPIASNSTEAGRAQNRRVEIKVVAREQ